MELDDRDPMSRILHTVALTVDDLPGLTGGAHYPARNVVERSPVAMIRQSLLFPTVVDMARFGHAIWFPMIDVVLLVAGTDKEPQQAARLDPLIPAVLDAFDPSRTEVPLQDVVNRWWKEPRIRRGAGPWGATGHCYHAIVTLDAQFARTA